MRGAWKRYAIADSTASPASAFFPAGGDVSAIAARPCERLPAPHRPVFVFASGYDAGWRAIDRGRWVAPVLANGWMMAWDASEASQRLVYLPAIFQLAGIVAMLIVLSVAIPLARRFDARAAASDAS